MGPGGSVRVIKRVTSEVEIEIEMDAGRTSQTPVPQLVVPFSSGEQ